MGLNVSPMAVMRKAERENIRENGLMEGKWLRRKWTAFVACIDVVVGQSNQIDGWTVG